MKKFRIKVGEDFEFSTEGVGEKVAFAIIQATLILGGLTIVAWTVVQVLGAN